MTPGRDDRGVGAMGMAMLLVSLSVLFIASSVGMLYVRAHAAHWPPEGSPRLPVGLWLSTAVLLVSSGTMHRALRAVRLGANGRGANLLVATFVLGLVFLGVQVANWFQLASQNLTARSNLYGFTFYMLTGLHGLHVIGGLIPLGIVCTRARRGAYGMFDHAGMSHMAMYWHFLDGVWLALFAMLMLAG